MKGTSLQLDLFSEQLPTSPETNTASGDLALPASASELPALAEQLLKALRIHSIPDHERCAAGGRIELERQANLILRGVASDRPRVTDERWQAALHNLPMFYVRSISINGIN